ncbi:alpha/beta hydrolase [Bradyrhizobium sp. 200]|uniref:alpha/beta hydrolase n=1 Tax=Bradyrhizobium sp. 200 TaxID=2782665 RepID=UPI001FFEB0F9|nr:alpha/beta hydrolase [Bradyrhizobium sp. 200]
METPRSSSERIILFCHGGGFQVGSIGSHFGLVRRLADAAHARVLAFDYRLAPEHRYPAALEDAISAYRWLLDRGIPPSRITLAGDSAGGALAVGIAVAARDNGLPMPACTVLISPWLDLAMRGESYSSRAELDIFSKPQQLAAMSRAYLGRHGTRWILSLLRSKPTSRDCRRSSFTPQTTTLRAMIPCCLRSVHDNIV